ncbi:MAG: hypothetical protein R2939_02815 [Kofleriaceae bacterium]
MIEPAEPSSLRRWVLPATEILTVGLPFCAFKLLTGLIALSSSVAAPVGYVLLGWGAVDLVLNLVNLGALLLRHRRVGAVCLTELALRRLGRATAHADLGLAVDVFLAFGLVALVVGLGWLRRLGAEAVIVWNLAVVLNVLGAGVGRLVGALRDVTPRGRSGASSTRRSS